MKKFLLVLLVTASFVVYGERPASAHHALVEGFAACSDTGVATITVIAQAWVVMDDGTLVPPERRVNHRVRIDYAPINLDSWTEIATDQFSPANDYQFTRTFNAETSLGSIRVRAVAVAQWGDGEEFPTVGPPPVDVVTLPTTCGAAPTTSVPTTTIPAATTAPTTTVPSTTAAKLVGTPPKEVVIDRPPLAATGTNPTFFIVIGAWAIVAGVLIERRARQRAKS